MALDPPLDHPADHPADHSADPLARARDLAHAEAPAGWDQVASAIRSRVRATVVPAEPVLVGEGALPDGSRTYVSTRVVRAVLRRLLQQGPTHAPVDIELRVAQERLVGVDLRLACAYGTDLLALGATVRAEVTAALVALLDAPPTAPSAVSVAVVDVVVGDPNLV